VWFRCVIDYSRIRAQLLPLGDANLNSVYRRTLSFGACKLDFGILMRYFLDQIWFKRLQYLSIVAS